MMHDHHLNSYHMGKELELLPVTQAIQNKIGSPVLIWQTPAGARGPLIRAMEKGIPSSQQRTEFYDFQGVLWFSPYFRNFFPTWKCENYYVACLSLKSFCYFFLWPQDHPYHTPKQKKTCKEHVLRFLRHTERYKDKCKGHLHPHHPV